MHGDNVMRRAVRNAPRRSSVRVSVLTDVLLAVLLAVPLVAVTAKSVSASTTPATRIDWSPCPKAPGYLCGTLRVPLDYQRPSRGSVRLSVIEHPALHSRGDIVFNPGGPGESGVLILPVLASLIPATLRSQFTLVSFDERGTGASQPLLCGPSAAIAGSAVVGTKSATRTFADLEGSCQADRPALFPTVTTTNSARDMDRLRAALGVSRINYYGLSYGTALGSVYAQLFPHHVRAMALDGAVDANLSLSADATAEAPAIGSALKYELNRCAVTPGCPLGVDPLTFYTSLERRLARYPLPAPGHGDTAPVTVGDLSTATLLYLSAPNFTPGYLPALASAAVGNGAPLRSVALGLETDLSGASLVGPLWTITCNDAVVHPDGSATAALANSLDVRYPLGGAEAVANNLIGCGGWGTSRGAIAHLSPIHGPTPLVIGNTGDPNTPYTSARRLAAAISGRLVTYVGFGHTWLLNGSSNACMEGVVTGYFLSGVLPATGTRCAA